MVIARSRTGRRTERKLRSTCAVAANSKWRFATLAAAHALFHLERIRPGAPIRVTSYSRKAARFTCSTLLIVTRARFWTGWERLPSRAGRGNAVILSESEGPHILSRAFSYRAQRNTRDAMRDVSTSLDMTRARGRGNFIDRCASALRPDRYRAECGARLHR